VPERPQITSSVRVLGPAALIVVAFIALLIALQVAGGVAPLQFTDPGPVVRWGLPIAKLLVNLGAAGAIGALVFAAFALEKDSDAYGRSLDIAAAASGIFAAASAVTGFLTFMLVTLQPLSLDDRFGSVLGSFLVDTEPGRAWLATTLIAAALTVACFAVRNQTIVAFMAIGGILGLIPMALQGHSGDASDHDQATSAIWLHIVFAAIWLGGLVTVALLARQLDRAKLGELVGRYSSVALVCFIVVAASGYVSAEIRVGNLANLATPYGALVLVKVLALVALGVFGVFQRRFFLRRMSTSASRAPFWGLVGGELAFMGLASGVAAALARSVTPISDAPIADDSPATALTDSPLPPPFSIENAITLWSFDLVWVLVCAFAITFYLWGVVRLHRRGDKWPIHRTVLWIAGMLLLFYITNGGLNLYGKYLFSAHMGAHMVLAMAVPVLLVPAAPVTLALRAIRKRTDASRGAREWILLLVHSRYFAVLSNPIVAAVIFVGSLLLFYYTPLFRWATTDHVGHEWMIVHFLLSGYLFVHALIGVDPSPYKAPYPMRLLVLLGTMAFHAFFGLSLLTGEALLLADWYGAMGWGTSAIADQQVGGGIAWSVGEIPTVILAVVVAISWSRSDEREAKRKDRQADRDGDAELEEYNRMLEQRERRTVTTRPR
jgi:cytochrome c oxidase assembly factor CtaG/putative copper export protein